MRVIIAGGGGFVPTQADVDLLDRLHAEHGFELVISGRCPTGGADHFGETWAKLRGIPVHAIEAAWGGYLGARAGFRRNQQMADLAGPGAMLVAFPGGPGTRDMIARAEAAGITVIRVPRTGTATRIEL